MVVLDPTFTVPLYSQAGAARIVDVSPNTFRNWSRGYAYRTLTGTRSAAGLITLAAPQHELVVPFIGLAEAYVIDSLRRAGLPMQRIRPAVEKLREEQGVQEALLSRRLKTDGVELLYEYLDDPDASPDSPSVLAVVRNKQAVFRAAVEQYLSTVHYSDEGLVDSIYPRRFGDELVIVDPRLNGGQPSFSESGVRVEDVRRRVDAGEPLDAVADDFDIAPAVVRLVLGRER